MFEATSSQRQSRQKRKKTKDSGYQLNPELLQARGDSTQIEREERLNAQILRIKSLEMLRKLQEVWRIGESELIDFFNSFTTIYQLIDCSQLIEMEETKLVKSEQKIFLGQISHRRKHGKGITIYRDGRFYEGDYRNNEKSGKGCEIYSNGNLYVGGYEQNKKHGKGTFYWFSLCDAPGTKQEQLKVEQYEGMWWGGLPDGEGQHQKTNGDFYLGHFKNGLKHGEGIQYYSNGDKYSGKFVNGLPQGFGQYQWADGSYYRGDFKQGFRNGYGVWHLGQGKEHYKGHYMLDLKHGYGIYDWANGYLYKGNFIEDQRSGKGSLYYFEQEVYSGFWLNGQKCEQEDYLSQQLYSKTTKTAASRYSKNKQGKKSRSKHRLRQNQKSPAKEDESFSINFKPKKVEKQSHINCMACVQRIGKSTRGTSKQNKKSQSKSKQCHSHSCQRLPRQI